MVQTLSNGEKYPAVPGACFQNCITELLGVLQDFYIGKVEMEGEVLLLEDLTLQVQTRGVQELKGFFMKSEHTVVS